MPMNKAILSFLERAKAGLTRLKVKVKLKINEKVKKSSSMTIMLVSVGLLFGLIFGFQYFKSVMLNKYLRAGGAPPVTVSTMKVEKQVWQPKYKASGSLRAVQGVEVTTEIAGLVRSIHFTPGALVKEGDVLVKLNADAEIAQLHVLESAVDLAMIVFTRDTEQYAIKAISKATLDSDVADLKGKSAQVAEQVATIAKKIICAPFSGRLGISAINLGQYVNVGDKIVTLQSLDPIYVDFYVPQQMVGQINVNQTVSITSDSFGGESFTGKITTIDPKADAATRNVQIEAIISNPDYKLLPGMYAKTEVNIGETQVYLTLPQSAISYNPYGELVYIINETGKNKKGEPIYTATQSFVTVGESRGDQVAVLTGLKAGDIVVTSGQHKIKNGSHVMINNAVMPTNNPTPNVVNN